MKNIDHVCASFQIRVRAYDDGVPPRENITTAAIFVNRNLNCPRWRQAGVSANIMETHDITNVVARVEATDADRQVQWAQRGVLSSAERAEVCAFTCQSGSVQKDTRAKRLSVFRLKARNESNHMKQKAFCLLQEPHNQIRYSIVGNALAQEYFVIDSSTGEIFQRKAVQLEPTMSKVYRVGQLSFKH